MEGLNTVGEWVLKIQDNFFNTSMKSGIKIKYDSQESLKWV